MRSLRYVSPQPSADRYWRMAWNIKVQLNYACFFLTKAFRCFSHLYLSQLKYSFLVTYMFDIEFMRIDSRCEMLFVCEYRHHEAGGWKSHIWHEILQISISIITLQQPLSRENWFIKHKSKILYNFSSFSFAVLRDTVLNFCSRMMEYSWAFMGCAYGNGEKTDRVNYSKLENRVSREHNLYAISMENMFVRP